MLSNVVHSQDGIHERYGGVVPEVASRAHVERLTAVVGEALRQAGCAVGELGAVAATVGPGLIGALLVGVQTAKTIAWSHRLPFIPVNHVHGHLAAVWLADPDAPFPMVTLVASGGHTSLILVEDKRTSPFSGRLWTTPRERRSTRGLACWGSVIPEGGSWTSWPRKGIHGRTSFPSACRGRRGPTSRSPGVKTALYYLLREMSEDERKVRAADVAAAYREAIVSALVVKTLRAAKEVGASTVAVAGGVAANSLLRRRLLAEGAEAGFHVVVPPFAYCTDNAAMIGAAALSAPRMAYPDYLGIDASASLALGQWSVPPQRLKTRKILGFDV